MIQFKGTRGITVPYFVYTLANLEIPSIRNYKDVLFLVIKGSE